MTSLVLPLGKYPLEGHRESDGLAALMAFLVQQHLPVWVPLCLVFVVFLGIVTSQDPPQTLDGELYCVSSMFSFTVVEVKGSNSKLLPVSTVTSSLRPPRPDLHPSYNSLMIQDDITRTLFIPDTNLIRIIELNSQTEDKIELSSCDPLLLRRFEAVPNETWVLCNPDGVRSSVKLYRLVGGGEKGWTADIPVTINSGNGSLLKDVGFVFHRNKEVHVVVATAYQVVWFTPRTNVREMQLLSDCGRLLQVTEFSKDSLLFECRQQADEPSSAVHVTVMYDLASAEVSGTVLNQGRTSGKIILSEDRQIIGIVASDRIIMELLVDDVRKQMVPLVTVSNNDIHDAFIDTTNGEYTLVYACSGGGVYSYNITAALGGIDVTPQLITKEETVCETDCVGLLPIGYGYFAVGLSEPEGVGWYSLSPPLRIGFASGAPSARLAFVLSMVDPDTVDRTVTEGPEEPTQDEGMSVGVVAAIVTGCFFVILLTAMPFSIAVVASLCIKRRKREGSYPVRWQPGAVDIQNNLAPISEIIQPQPDGLQLPVQATNRSTTNDDTSSSGSSAVLVPGIDRLTTIPHGSTGTSHFGESFEALANKELEANV